MRKQALVIGLGQFGMSLVRALAARNVEVLAVDRDPSLAQAAASVAVEAVAFNAVDEAALARAAPAERDYCICAIGTDKESSIICTAILRQLGARYLVSRAINPVHERILRLVGAHEVVNPDQELGSRMAKRLLYKGMLDAVPLGEELSIVELRVPPGFVGQSLLELGLPRRHGITVAAIRHHGDRVELPKADRPLAADDVLVVVAPEAAVEALLRRGQP
jgi:trk system potassium uptake protein TrkA